MPLSGGGCYHIEAYGLTPAENHYTQSCKKTMSAQGTRFGTRLSNEQGCACIAQHAYSSFEADQISASQDLFAARQSLEKQAQGVSDYMLRYKIVYEQREGIEAVREDHNMESRRFSKMESTFDFVLSKCSHYKTHTPKNITRWATL